MMMTPDDSAGGGKSKAEKQAELKAVIDKVEVICCTCSASADVGIRSRQYRTVIIDEAGNATAASVVQ